MDKVFKGGNVIFLENLEFFMIKYCVWIFNEKNLQNSRDFDKKIYQS